LGVQRANSEAIGATQGHISGILDAPQYHLTKSTNDADEFTRKRVLATGGTNGAGKAIADRFSLRRCDRRHNGSRARSRSEEFDLRALCEKLS
jgi:hypothetical protein